MTQYKKTKKIIQEEQKLKLSYQDATLFINALDKPVVHLRLKKAMKNYKQRTVD